MKVICDFYSNIAETSVVTNKYLYEHGFIDEGKRRQIINVLCSMGYITYDNLSGIQLTDKGKCYFEVESDRANEKRIEMIRYVITTSIAVAAFIKSFFF